MDIVAAAARHCIHDATHGAPEFCRKTIRQNLEFLDRVLRNLCCDTRPSGIFVVVAVGCVIAVRKKSIAHRRAPKTDESENTIVGNCGGEQYERVDTAAVNGKVIDLFRCDKLRDTTFGLLYEGCLCGDAYFCSGASHFQSNFKVHGLADLDRKILRFPGAKSLQFDGQVVARCRYESGSCEHSSFTT